MPWVIAALMALAGGAYYETNKKPTSMTYLLKFGALDSPAVLSGLMDIVNTMHGTVDDLGGGTYKVIVPYDSPFFQMLPPLLRAPEVTTSVSGTRIGALSNEPLSMRTGKHYFLTQHEPGLEGGPQRSRNAGGGFSIAGMKWDGARLT